MALVLACGAEEADSSVANETENEADSGVPLDARVKGQDGATKAVSDANISAGDSSAPFNCTGKADGDYCSTSSTRPNYWYKCKSSARISFTQCTPNTQCVESPPGAATCKTP